MKDSFKKIQSLADELAKNADVTNGGGIIILASNPHAEKGESASVMFVKGIGIELITILSASFAANENLKEFSKHALFMSSMIPDSLFGKKEEKSI